MNFSIEFLYDFFNIQKPKFFFFPIDLQSPREGTPEKKVASRKQSVSRVSIKNFANALTAVINKIFFLVKGGGAAVREQKKFRQQGGNGNLSEILMF